MCIHLCTNDVIKVMTHLPINTSIYKVPERNAAMNYITWKYIINILCMLYVKLAWEYAVNTLFWKWNAAVTVESDYAAAPLFHSLSKALERMVICVPFYVLNTVKLHLFLFSKGPYQGFIQVKGKTKRHCQRMRTDNIASTQSFTSQFPSVLFCFSMFFVTFLAHSRSSQFVNCNNLVRGFLK